MGRLKFRENGKERDEGFHRQGPGVEESEDKVEWKSREDKIGAAPARRGAYWDLEFCPYPPNKLAEARLTTTPKRHRGETARKESPGHPSPGHLVPRRSHSRRPSAGLIHCRLGRPEDLLAETRRQLGGKALSFKNPGVWVPWTLLLPVKLGYCVLQSVYVS